jgi:hypothetical protein
VLEAFSVDSGALHDVAFEHCGRRGNERHRVNYRDPGMNRRRMATANELIRSWNVVKPRPYNSGDLLWRTTGNDILFRLYRVFARDRLASLFPGSRGCWGRNEERTIQQKRLGVYCRNPVLEMVTVVQMSR